MPPRASSLGLALSLALSLAACVDVGGPPSIDTADYEITGGTAEAGYPSVFALAYNGQGGCTGTCIAPTVGLTAAHCVQGEPASVLSALFGDTEGSPRQVIQVTEVAIESSFGETNRDADIALLRFAEACPATTPANKTPLEAHVGEPVVMVGFGVTVETADDAGIKRSGVATLFSVSPADVSGMNLGELATSNDPHGTCDGDSGGPTFMTFAGAEYVVGVTSRGSTGASGVDEPCGRGRSIATRPDSYAAFIDGFIGGDGTPEPDPGETDTPPEDGEEPADSEEPFTTSGCQLVDSSTGNVAWLMLVVGLLWRRRRRLADTHAITES